jgi:predicted enzyme related to lactoylglutathione lyase
MPRPVQGTPCWYELATTDLDAAQAFYATVIGWSVSDSGMPGMDYRIAGMDGAMVAGLGGCEAPDDAPRWTIYFAVDDCDKATAKAKRAKARVRVKPTDIPGVGRFAALADPQGAAFSILAMEDESQAFGQMKPGQGVWHELMSTDPVAGLAFYSGLFGWTKSTPMDMGEMGTYQIFAHQGQDIGGMIGMGNAPHPCWLPYFAVDSIDAAIARIQGAGGQKAHGPMEVPGGAFVVVATDPQGAHFALVGGK